MNNIKLTLATTFSVLMMALSHSAFANDWESGKKYQYQKNKVVVTSAARKNTLQKNTSTVSNNVANQRITQRQNTNNVYAIRSGDTLYRVSLKTGVSVDKLARLNRLNKKEINSLQIGQILKLG